VTVVEPDHAHLARAAERAGEALATLPDVDFDAAVAQDSADLTGVHAARVLLVARDGSVTERR
jgi:hypothetical protein